MYYFLAVLQMADSTGELVTVDALFTDYHGILKWCLLVIWCYLDTFHKVCHINLHHVPYLSLVFAVQMDVISYSAAISACEKSSEWQQSMRFSGECKRPEADMMEGITPNHMREAGAWGVHSYRVLKSNSCVTWFQILTRMRFHTILRWKATQSSVDW